MGVPGLSAALKMSICRRTSSMLSRPEWRDPRVVARCGRVTRLAEEHIEVGRLLGLREVGIAQDDAVLLGEAGVLDHACHLGEEGVGVVRHEQADGMRLLAARAA